MTRDVEVARSVLWAPVYTEAPVSLLCKQSEPPLRGSFRCYLFHQQGKPRVKGSHESHDFYGLLSNWNMTDVARERRRISGRRFSPTERVWTRRPHGKSEKYAFIMIYLKP